MKDPEQAGSLSKAQFERIERLNFSIDSLERACGRARNALEDCGKLTPLLDTRFTSYQEIVQRMRGLVYDLHRHSLRKDWQEAARVQTLISELSRFVREDAAAGLNPKDPTAFFTQQDFIQ